MNEKMSGELKSCMRCGNMFLYTGIEKCICSKCKEKDVEEFEIVKNYIYENLSATIREVSIETGIRVVRIRSFIKDGRLIIPDGSAVFMKCEVCDTDIKYGRVCRECMNTLSNDIKNIMSLDEFQVGERPNLINVKLKKESSN